MSLHPRPKLYLFQNGKIAELDIASFGTSVIAQHRGGKESQIMYIATVFVVFLSVILSCDYFLGQDKHLFSNLIDIS